MKKLGLVIIAIACAVIFLSCEKKPESVVRDYLKADNLEPVGIDLVQDVFLPDRYGLEVPTGDDIAYVMAAWSNADAVWSDAEATWIGSDGEKLSGIFFLQHTKPGGWSVIGHYTDTEIENASHNKVQQSP